MRNTAMATVEEIKIVGDDDHNIIIMEAEFDIGMPLYDVLLMCNSCFRHFFFIVKSWSSYGLIILGGYTFGKNEELYSRPVVLYLMVVVLNPTSPISAFTKHYTIGQIKYDLFNT